MSITSDNLTEDLKLLTSKVIKCVSESVDDLDFMLKNSRHFKEMGLTLEKLANIVMQLRQIDADSSAEAEKNKYPDDSTDEQKYELLEATINYYENNRAHVHRSADYLKDKINKKNAQKALEGSDYSSEDGAASELSEELSEAVDPSFEENETRS